MVTLGLGSGCGYILYPYRTGRRGGEIDVPVLIIDLLWFLPGLIPGAICLIVDFTTGCVYRGEGRVGAPRPTPSDSRVLATVTMDALPVANGELREGTRVPLTWSTTVDRAALQSRGRIVVQRADGARAEAPIAALL